MANNFRITFPISKSEELADGRMLVRGIATSDAIDKQGERLLFGGSVKAFQKWLDTGPAVREQHDPLKAVGSGLSFTPLPDEGAIAVEVFVSAAEVGTQTKLREKVLRSFSIGGTPLGKNLVKVGDKIIKEIPEWEMEELSLVDRPANPDCQITFTKAGSILATKEDQVAEKKKGKPPEGEDEEKPATGAVTPPAEEKPGEEKPAAPGAAEGGKEPPAEEGEGKPAPAGEAGEEGQESGKDEPPAAAPPAVEKPPLSDDDLGKIVASVTDAVLAAIKEQTEAVKAGATAQVKAIVGMLRKADDAQITIWDLRLGLDCLDMLSALLSYEEGEKTAGMAEPAIQVEKLKAAIKALGEFIVSEAGELISEDDVLLASARPIKLLKSAPPATEAAPSPEVGPQIESLTKAVESLTLNVSAGESLRDVLGKLQKGIDTVLSLAVPGRAPAKFASAVPYAEERGETVRILENMLAKADTLSRPAIERELNMLHARNGS